MFWLHLVLAVVGGGLIAATLLPFSPMTLKLYMPKRQTMIALHRHRLWLRIAGSSALAALLGLALADEAAAGWGWAAIGLAVFFVMFFATGYVPVVMRPPPVHRSRDAGEADELVGGDTDVLGVVVDGDAAAYSRTQLARPHVFIDELGGHRVAITYCILCNTAMAFRAELDDRPLNLRPVTAFNNNIIYHDARTGDYVQQLEATVVAGPDAGRHLEPVHATISTWDTWRSLYPDSRFVDLPPTGPRDKMMSRMLDWMIPLEGLRARAKPWHPVRGRPDSTIDNMAMVLGVTVGGEDRAYPVETLAGLRVVDDTLGGKPIVVMYDTDRDTAAVYSRRWNDHVLDFADASPSAAAVDSDGARWDITGSEIGHEGVAQSRQLEPIPHFGKLFWFSWSLFRPETTIFVPN